MINIGGVEFVIFLSEFDRLNTEKRKKNIMQMHINL